MDIILNKIKNIDKNAQKILEIEKSFYSNYYHVRYISFYIDDQNKPRFKCLNVTIDIRKEIRDIKINDILTFDKTIDFDVESIIYTEDQLKNLEKLREKKENKTYRVDAFYDFIKDYSDNFKIGEPVYYNNHHGIITFKHELKDPNKNSLWSVLVNDKEFRYVDGRCISKRKVQDLSNGEIDPKLNKLSTERLLKMYKRSLVIGKGNGNIEIKRILNEREHIKKGDIKIINLNH